MHSKTLASFLCQNCPPVKWIDCFPVQTNEYLIILSCVFSLFLFRVRHNWAESWKPNSWVIIQDHTLDPLRFQQNCKSLIIWDRFLLIFWSPWFQRSFWTFFLENLIYLQGHITLSYCWCLKHVYSLIAGFCKY